jgi:hypothetical protein
MSFETVMFTLVGAFIAGMLAGHILLPPRIK